MRFKLPILLIFLLVLANSCKQSSNETQFIPLSNYPGTDTISLEMDTEGAILNGISIPSNSQNPEGFAFSFDIPEDLPSNEDLYYKIYYQNESYKFPENDPLAEENFYGSWIDNEIGFKKIDVASRPESGKVTDHFRIVGNPRNEQKYYGAAPDNIEVTPQKIEKLKTAIKSSKKWLAGIKKKAIKNNRTTEHQLYLDALWMLKNRLNDGNTNNRWKRNPRAGNYSFLLVVATQKGLETIPEYVQNIGLKKADGHFENPFTYFREQGKTPNPDVRVIPGSQVLKTFARIQAAHGVYLNPLYIREENSSEEYLNAGCSSSHELFEKAHFQQFFHNINRSYELKNVPIARDVVKDEYTRAEYDQSIKDYKENELIKDFTHNSENPCQTVQLDLQDSSIVISNRGNLGRKPADFRKENVGIKTRIGFSYGKWRAKIKFPEIINSESVWNGLTNAYWLIYQDDGAWNKRRICHDQGFIPKSNKGPEYKREPQLTYSEIDIEIVKTSKYWLHPQSKKRNNLPPENARNNGEIMVTCTNWDLACPQPSNFSTGISQIEYHGKTYETHRWSDYYKALTIKSPEMDDELFQQDFYYYEIEWKPTEIIWRVGPHPDKMHIVGYMNDQVTMIPNNQMLAVITQEFHYAEWWPYAPYSQNYVPYPKNDIVGRVYEIVIE